MGLLVEGVWKDEVYEARAGRFVRVPTSFRSWVTPDGSPGPSGQGGFAAEPGRYHLYVSLACPWAHRTVIFRKLKGLEDLISLSVVEPRMGGEGWVFGAGEGAIPDFVNHKRRLADIYLIADPHYTGRVAETVSIDHIKRHYYCSHRHINPTGIVPLGPALDFSAPHDRARFAS